MYAPLKVAYLLKQFAVFGHGGNRRQVTLLSCPVIDPSNDRLMLFSMFRQCIELLLHMHVKNK